jgi:hypothetical protein
MSHPRFTQADSAAAIASFQKAHRLKFDILRFDDSLAVSYEIHGSLELSDEGTRNHAESQLFVELLSAFLQKREADDDDGARIL